MLWNWLVGRGGLDLMVFLLPLLSALAVNLAPVDRDERHAPESANARISTIEVFQEGGWKPVSAGGSVRGSSTDARQLFRFAADTPSHFRYRYRMEGYDPAWRAPSNGFRLVIRFVDDAEQSVMNNLVYLQGTSAGWSGSLETSTMTAHREILIAPERATSLRLAFTSAGRPNEVGILAVQELKVKRLGPRGSAPITLLDTQFDEGDRLEKTNGVPNGWQRQGTSGAIAQVWNLPGKRNRVLLVLADTDSTRGGVWSMSSSGQIPVKPGQRLAIEWLSVHSEGSAGPAEAVYPALPAGKYRFRVQALRPFGKPAAPERSFIVDIRLPFWQTDGFFKTCLVGITGLVLLIVRHLTVRRLRRQLERSQRKSALDDERGRIARDIHDHLGANLTQIALLSELVQSELNDPAQASAHLNEIFSTAHGLARQLEEVVWAVEPANDSLDQLANFLCNFSQNFLSAARISCRFDVPAEIPDIPLSVLQRHNVFLATKESLHNVVKHAEASDVWLRLVVTSGSRLRIEIEDNGRGISTATPASRPGKGFANIKDRIENIGGRVESESRVGGGTRIRMTIPLAGVKE